MKNLPVLKFLAFGLLVFLAPNLQAQVLKKIQFTPVEGYTNGWLIGQPSIGTQWENANGNTDFGGLNNGRSLMIDDKPFLMATATNWSGTKWAMMIASDGNQGTNNSVYYWRIPFPQTLTGPITVEWDWQYFPTNQIPADFDPTNSCPITAEGQALPCTNEIGANLQTTDVGFTLADSANAEFGDNPNVVFNELSGITRLGGDHVADSRFNEVGVCEGKGDWFKRGPRYQDGKLIHEKMVAYVGLTGDAAATNDTIGVWANRQGEAVIQTASPVEIPDYGAPDGPKSMPAFGMRRCPNEYNVVNGTGKTSGINCITLWMNSSPDKFGTYVLISNIRVTGPNPVPVPNLKIEPSVTSTKVTFEGWLEAADAPQGPYTVVAVTSPYQIPSGAAGQKYYRASN